MSKKPIQLAEAVTKAKRHPSPTPWPDGVVPVAVEAAGTQANLRHLLVADLPALRVLALVSLALAGLLLAPSPAQAGYRDGMSLYEYVGSGPVSHRDPSGLVGYDEVDRALDDAEDTLATYRQAYQKYRSLREQGANIALLRDAVKGLEMYYRAYELFSKQADSLFNQWLSEIGPLTAAREHRIERAWRLPPYAALLVQVVLEKKKIEASSPEESARVERELEQAPRRVEEARVAARKWWKNYTNTVRNIPGGETTYQWLEGNWTAGGVAFGVDVAGTIGPSKLLGLIPAGGRWSRVAKLGGATGSGLFLPGVPIERWSAAGSAARQAFDAATNYDNPLPNFTRLSAELANDVIHRVGDQ
jgi:hypothetical protein